MAMKYVSWRAGRPRFNPGPKERMLGFQAEDLKRPDGTWLARAETVTWARARLEEIVTARRAGGRVALEGKVRVGGNHTLADLLNDWINSPHIARKAKATVQAYKTSVDAILHKPTARRRKRLAIGEVEAPRELEPFAHKPIEAIGRPELRAFFEYAREARGHQMATNMVSVISAAWTWGAEQIKWRHLPANPRTKMHFDTPEGRIVTWTIGEFDALVKAADELGMASVGDAIYLGFYTGQRQADRLRFIDAGVVEGRHTFRQNKTGAVVRIKVAPDLARRLTEARRRVAELKLAKGTRPDEIVVSESTGLAWHSTTYNEAFRKVRAHAAATMPSVGRLRDQDLRDTCVTMLYRAGCDLLEICSITGHSASSVELIRKHYLGDATGRADNAIDRLAAFVADGRKAAT